jgi:hypothetical protein
MFLNPPASIDRRPRAAEPGRSQFIVSSAAHWEAAQATLAGGPRKAGFSLLPARPDERLPVRFCGA